LAGLDFEETFLELSGGKFDPFSPELAAVKMLLLPQGMGESHKVLVQGKGVPSGLVLKGFSLKNIMKRL
jgi:SAM-dependent MidA family methyltransferase